jgi:hypothetical protein
VAGLLNLSGEDHSIVARHVRVCDPQTLLDIVFVALKVAISGRV